MSGEQIPAVPGNPNASRGEPVALFVAGTLMSPDFYHAAGQDFYVLLSGPEPFVTQNLQGNERAYSINDRGGIDVKDPGKDGSHPTVLGAALFVDMINVQLSKGKGDRVSRYHLEEARVVSRAIRHAQLVATEADSEQVEEAQREFEADYGALTSAMSGGRR